MEAITTAGVLIAVGVSAVIIFAICILVFLSAILSPGTDYMPGKKNIKKDDDYPNKRRIPRRIINDFECIERHGLPRLASDMITEEGFYEHLDGARALINAHVGDDRVCFVYSDGRFYFDSNIPDVNHNGTRVYQEENLKEAVINDAGPSISSLAIENHMTRPEVFGAFKGCDIISEHRVSDTSGTRQTYYAKSYYHRRTCEHIVIRISVRDRL